MQLIVLGMHRSGTSAVARLLNLMGAYFSPENQIMEKKSDNPSGFWERKDVMALNDDILAAANASWDNVSRFNLDKIKPNRREELDKRIRSIIKEMDHHKPWMIKDPRLGLSFPLWRPFLDTPICIFVFRDPIQIAQSLLQRNRFPLHVGLALWEYYLVKTINSSDGLPRILVRYDEVMLDPLAEIKRLQDALTSFDISGLSIPDKNAVCDFIDESLFHERGGEDLYQAHLSLAQKDLLKRVKDGTIFEQPEPLTISDGASEILFSHSVLSLIHMSDKTERHSKLTEEIKERLDTISLDAKKMLDNRTRDNDDPDLATARRQYQSNSSQFIALFKYAGEEFDKQISHLGEQVAETYRQNNELNRQVDRVLQQNSELTNTLNSSRKTIAELESSLKIQQQQQQHALDRVIGKSNLLQSELDEREQAEESLKQQLQSQLDRSALTEDALNQKIETLEQSNVSLRSQLGTADTKIHEFDRWILGLASSVRTTYKSRDWRLGGKPADFTRIVNGSSNAISELESSLTFLRNSHQKEIDLAEEKSNLLQSQLDRSALTEETLNQKIEALEQRSAALRTDINNADVNIQQLDRWIVELATDIRATYKSMRWRFGDNVLRIVELLTFRRNSQRVSDHIKFTLHEHATWRTQRPPQERFDAIVVPSSQAHSGKLALFRKLLATALRNPVKTGHLVSAERLRNLYITFAQQPVNVACEITDYYIQLYGSKDAYTEISALRWRRTSASSANPIVLPAQEKPSISIIIPVYNNFQTTIDCLASIVQNTQNVRYEVIIADDVSTDQTTEITSYVRNAMVIHNEENMGFLHNCNNAVKHACGEYLVLLNNDTFVHPGWLEALYTTANIDRSVGLVGPMLLFGDGKLQEAGGIIWDDASGWNYGRGDDPGKPEYQYIKDTDYISGACFLIRKSLWDKLGGFDERFAPAYYEDTDMAFAVRRQGYRVVYQPSAVVTHLEGVSHGTDSSSGVKKHQEINRSTFLEKWSDVLSSEHFPNSVNVFLARDRSRSRKTILVVDHYVPQYDKDAGSKCTFCQLKLFVDSGLNVKFIGDNFFKDEPYTTVLNQLGIEVLHGPWYATNWDKWIQDNAEYIDYAYIHRPHIAPKYIEAISRFPNVKIIYFGHDLHYLRTMRQYEIEQDPGLLKVADEWKKAEFDIFEKSTQIYYPSYIETREVKENFPNAIARTIPLYFYDDIPEIRKDPAKRQDLLFVGGFRHVPNIDGATWFAKEIFPLICKQDQDINLIIVGSNMPNEIRGLASDRIRIASEVPQSELDSLYLQCRIVVVPLRFGAGVKGKVLEALFNQVPVVTTDIGAEGLPEADTYLHMANTAEEFESTILRFYHDIPALKKFSALGRKALLKHFSSKAAKEILSEDIEFPKYRLENSNPSSRANQEMIET